MSVFGPLDNLLAAYGELQERLRLAEAENAALVEREQRLAAALIHHVQVHNYEHEGCDPCRVIYEIVDADFKACAALAASPSAVAVEPRVTICTCSHSTYIHEAAGEGRCGSAINGGIEDCPCLLFEPQGEGVRGE